MSFEYQIKAFKKLSELKCGALFMKMGTGKTKTMLDIIMRHADNIDCIAWIAPASLLNDGGYLSELIKWNTKGVLTYKFSIEGIALSDNRYCELINLAEKKRVFCVIDESLSIKNLISKRTKRLLENGNKFAFRFILNGTPLSRSLVDLYPQIQFLSPRILNMTEAQFANNFLEYDKTGFRPYAKWSKPHNEQALIEILRPYIFDQDLEIESKKQINTHNLKLTPLEKSNYSNFKNDVLKNGVFDFLAISQKFQSFYTFSKNKEKLIKSIASDKCIIFVKFLHEVDKLKSIFKNVFVYTGKEKDDLSLFKIADKGILIMTYGTGAMGLNLQFCNHIIFFTPTFDYKQRIHAEARCHRMGQGKNVIIDEIYLDTGLDKLINYSLSRKEKLLCNIEKFVKNNGDL
jgi:SNF2 family DNA or RNA helicase